MAGKIIKDTGSLRSSLLTGGVRPRTRRERQPKLRPVTVWDQATTEEASRGQQYPIANHVDRILRQLDLSKSAFEGFTVMTERRWLGSEDPLAMDRYAARFMTEAQRGFWIASYALKKGETAFSEVDKPRMAAVLRDIVGNPFRPPTICEQHPGVKCAEAKAAVARWLAWDGGTVHQLAQAAHGKPEMEFCWECAEVNLKRSYCSTCKGTCDPRNFRYGAECLAADRLAVLADALEEAGCDCRDLLEHLRGWERCPKCLGSGLYSYQYDDGVATQNCLQCKGGLIPLRGPHVRGCWAVELLRGAR